MDEELHPVLIIHFMSDRYYEWNVLCYSESLMLDLIEKKKFRLLYELCLIVFEVLKYNEHIYF